MNQLAALRRPKDSPEDIQAARSLALTLAKEVQLGSLAELLERKQQEHAELQRELDASNAALTRLLQETRETVLKLHQRASLAKSSYTTLYSDVTDFHEEIYSPISRNADRSSTGTASTTGSTLFETLQSMHARIETLTTARSLFEKLAKTEELSLIAKEQIKLDSPDSSIETYQELVKHVIDITKTGSHVTGQESRQLASAPFVVEVARDTWRELVKALEAKLVSRLNDLNWPGTKLQQDDLDYDNDSKAKAFKKAFLDICKLERIGLDNPLPAEEQISGKPNDECALAVVALAQPLILRFRYHFDGKRQTNRLDKPEWYFAHILNALHDHASFIRNDIQALLSQGGLRQVDAMQDFTTALLRALSRKVRSTVPQLLEMPSIFAHTLYQALQFDETLRSTYGYTPRKAGKGERKEEWSGISDIILGNKDWFQGWKDAEREFTDNKFFEMIGSPDAWHINEDYAASTSNTLRPTNSAIKVRDLFDQVTDRYRPLHTFQHRLPFLIDIQLPLLDGYLQRISSATDAFEPLSYGLMRAVPGTLAGMEGSNVKLTNGLNGLQRLVRAYVSASWMETTCKEWSEDIFFLEFWQEIQEVSIRDYDVRKKCQTLIDHATAAMSKAQSSEDAGLFSFYIVGYRKLAERISELIVKHIVREVTSELKPYLNRRWDLSAHDESDEARSSEISTELATPLTIFTALLAPVSAALPALTVNKLYRQAASQIQESLLVRSVFPKVWSEEGGKQFRFDVEQGWLGAVREASKGKIRKPENGFRKLVDASLLVSLPSSIPKDGSSIASLSLSPGLPQIPIAKVVQVTWDDTNDAAFHEILMKLGVKELTSRKDVKAILRKRPECWR